jgi:predicted amidophosphoribosyltransferase
MKERAQNVADAFVVRNPKKIIGKNILIVDDIITTGATIQECGRVLVKGGAKTIYACSIAVADF